MRPDSMATGNVLHAVTAECHRWSSSKLRDSVGSMCGSSNLFASPARVREARRAASIGRFCLTWWQGLYTFAVQRGLAGVNHSFVARTRAPLADLAPIKALRPGCRLQSCVNCDPFGTRPD